MSRAVEAQRTAAASAMDRYASGDGSAFGDLYNVLGGPLLGFLMRQTRDRASAEDLVQQTFLQMHVARASYRTGADVVPWAFAIARRLAVDSFRRGRREVIGVLDRQEPMSPAPGPDGALDEKQAGEMVNAALAAMPESHRLAFELVKYDGLTLAEAAEALGTTVAAIKVRTHRVHCAVRQAVGAT